MEDNHARRTPAPCTHARRLPSYTQGNALLAAASVAAIVLCFAAPASAQSNETQIVVTPFRTPTAISRAGSDITVISRDEIQQKGQRNLIDALRGAPGVDVRQSGGIGSIAYVTLRGSSPARP